MFDYKNNINEVDIINIHHLYKLINKYNDYRILINQPKLKLYKQYKNIDNFIECDINDDNFEVMINRLMSATTMLIADINHQNKTILIYNKKLNLPTFENYMNMKYQDKIILENLIKKYGKNDILISINEDWNREQRVYKNYKRMITLADGENYRIVEIEFPESWDGDNYDYISELAKGEAMMAWNHTYIYRDMNGEVWQCYRDDINNCWRI